MSPSARFTAAVVQAAPVASDLAATLDKVERLAGEAAALQASVIVFPEAFVSCYPRGLDFGTVVGARTPEGRAWFRRYWESSVEVPGPAVDRARRRRRRTRSPSGDRGDRARRRHALLHDPWSSPRRASVRASTAS